MVCAHVCNIISVTKIAADRALNKRNVSFLLYSIVINVKVTAMQLLTIFILFIFIYRKDSKKRPEVIKTTVYASHCCLIND